jgi:hypothetical protein
VKFWLVSGIGTLILAATLAVILAGAMWLGSRPARAHATAPGQRPCRRCGHSRAHHEHFHAGTSCGGCPCPSYRCRATPAISLFPFRRRTL